MMVCTMAMASAVSVPGFGFSHLDEWIAVALKSGAIVTTSVPLYLASQKKWASGMRVAAGLARPDQHALRLVDGGHVVAGQVVAERHVGADGQVAHAGEGLGNHDAGDVGEAEERRERGALQDHLRAHGEGDRVGARLGGVLDDLVGDLADRLVPADPLPLALAALADPLHRVEHALLAVHVLGVADALLAAARTVVRRVLAGAAVLALLLLAPDDAVLDVDVEGAVAGAVDAPAAPDHPVPGPLAAHHVFPEPVHGRRRRPGPARRPACT